MEAMRIYWYQAGLHIEPEGPEELAMLRYVQNNIRLGRAPIEESFPFVTGEKIPERQISIESGNKQAV
jgi:hypothetical protein